MAATVDRHEFQAEVKQLLDIVIHSLYSNRDVFLRELISNASDALDKLRFEALTSDTAQLPEELHIRIDRDRDDRTITVTDNGIGMSREELVENLGTIARSGTAEFLARVREAKGQLTPDLIGQFGVGFYASFMVADRVSVLTRRAGESAATKWESAGDGFYNISEAERETPGTTITLHLKSVDEDEGIRDYTDEWTIREIVKRYSDFVGYPIRMETQQQDVERDAEGKPKAGAEPRLVTKDETLNSMKAIWTRPAGEVTDDEYREFYHHITHDWSDPLAHIAVKMEGTLEARALLYIPRQAPFDLYYRDMSYRGLQLYVKRVFIMDECRDLMPAHLRFVRGVVDAEDLSLNVSRELLQQDRQITAIRRFLIRKVMDRLKTLKTEAPDDYRQFWDQLGPALKEGLLTTEDTKEPLLDLVLAHTTSDADRMTDLADYVGRMGADQSEIYYLVGPSLDAVRRSPHLEAFAARDIEVLLFTDAVDELWLDRAPEYQGKSWRSVSKGDVTLDSADRETAAAELKNAEDRHKDLLGKLTAILKDHVKDVRLTNRLTTSAACLVGEEHELSPQMAEMLRHAGQDVPEVKRTLELNPAHPVLTGLLERFSADPEDDVVADYAHLLLGQALLAEGAQLPDPAGFSDRLSRIMQAGLG